MVSAGVRSIRGCARKVGQRAAVVRSEWVQGNEFVADVGRGEVEESMLKMITL